MELVLRFKRYVRACPHMLPLTGCTNPEGTQS